MRHATATTVGCVLLYAMPALADSIEQHFALSGALDVPFLPVRPRARFLIRDVPMREIVARFLVERTMKNQALPERD